MSYINKEGKTTAWRVMTVRQQVSAVLSYGKIQTTLKKAKNTQKRLEKIITIAKVDNFNNRRAVKKWLLNTNSLDVDQLTNHLFKKVAPRFLKRNGGYSRVLKLGVRRGDSTEMVILQLIDATN
ncbi:50S ribosomal protein L17 [Mycoplasmoides genitalium]|uniref:50S ribosomal protein L17 n=1 Tax=Mycoplasmoides genitalium TaxID=2097 RepID=UPI00027B378B|nr:50S ribosomal protein L17 [Mycoplasmoides genitalium]AFQ04494.1 50S ribosomal protein L17 [Mycoplasmoides genitalium M2288]